MIEEDIHSEACCGSCKKMRKCVFVMRDKDENQGFWTCAECARAIANTWAVAASAFPIWFDSERSKL